MLWLYLERLVSSLAAGLFVERGTGCEDGAVLDDRRHDSLGTAEATAGEMKMTE